MDASCMVLDITPSLGKSYKQPLLVLFPSACTHNSMIQWFKMVDTIQYLPRTIRIWAQWSILFFYDKFDDMFVIVTLEPRHFCDVKLVYLYTGTRGESATNACYKGLLNGYVEPVDCVWACGWNKWVIKRQTNKQNLHTCLSQHQYCLFQTHVEYNKCPNAAMKHWYRVVKQWQTHIHSKNKFNIKRNFDIYIFLYC